MVGGDPVNKYCDLPVLNKYPPDFRFGRSSHYPSLVKAPSILIRRFSSVQDQVQIAAVRLRLEHRVQPSEVTLFTQHPSTGPIDA